MHLSFAFTFSRITFPLMNEIIMGLGSVPWFVPRGVDLVNNLPGVILTLWIGLVFATMVYFHGNVKDLESKPGSVTPIQKNSCWGDVFWSMRSCWDSLFI